MFTIPATGTFVQLKHDYEWRPNHKPRAFRRAMPETVPMLNKEQFVPLNKEWQWFWFELLIKASQGNMRDCELIAAWASLTCDKRAFTDRHAVQNGFADYILGKNLGAKPISIKTISCGGNILQTDGRKGMRVFFRTLDVRESPPLVDEIWNDRAVIHFATECVRYPEKGYPNKTYLVDKFPQLLGMDVPFPIVSTNGINATWRLRTKPILNWQQFSPYNPPA